jgi:hypothetical protein
VPSALSGSSATRLRGHGLVDALSLSAAGTVLERELRRRHWASHEPTID